MTKTHDEAQLEKSNLIELSGPLSKANSVLYLLDKELKNSGFAGKTNIPKLIYLSAITRVLERPVSIAIKGPSSSGKSYSLEAGLRFIPDSVYQKFQGLSDKALAYSIDVDFKNKLLVLGEAAGLAEGNGRALLRQLLTENIIRYRSVTHTAKDGHAAKEFIIRGPVALLLTTTADALHHEEETRLISIHIDHSPEQLKRVLLSLSFGRQKCTPEIDLSCWHAWHEHVCSGDVRVDIPYWNVLLEHVPVTHPRVLRDIPKVASLIQAHALLHREIRPRDEFGRIQATLEDYYHVHSLVAEPLAQGLNADVPTHIRQVVEIVIRLNEKERCHPTVTEVARELNAQLSTVSRNVKNAIMAGYLNDLNPGQGKRAMLIPGDVPIPKGNVLPDPLKMAELIGKIEIIRTRSSSLPGKKITMPLDEARMSELNRMSLEEFEAQT